MANRVEQFFHKLEQKLEHGGRKMEASFEKLEQKFDAGGRKMEASFEKLEQKLEGKAQQAEQSFEKFERKLDNGGKQLEQSFEKLENRLEAAGAQLERRMEAFEKKLDVILETDQLKKRFSVRTAGGGSAKAAIKAVDGVNLQVAKGETLGIVGESGCGKSTVARMMIGLLPPTEGTVRLFGQDLSKAGKADLKAIRRRTGIVFQDPYGSLDPRMTIADIVGEPLRAHGIGGSTNERLLRTMETLEACGLDADNLFRFPHQFSGGQRQRVCIARALVADPDVVVCDEAVSALDVSIQAQIINLLCDLRASRGLTYIFISHDLDVVRFIADRVAVMYMGRVVELAPKDELFARPLHPYTVALLESAPVFGRRAAAFRESVLPGEILADESAQTSGCRYRNRCPFPLPECALHEPSLCEVAPGHSVACHRVAAGGDA